MLVRVTTDNNIDGSDKLSGFIEDIVTDVLGRFAERITRVEAHLTDENSRAKSGENDIRCTLEARLSGLKPVVVSAEGETVDQAIRGTAEKLEKTLDRTLGRLDDRKGRTSSAGE